MLVAFENFGLQGEYIYAIDPLGTWETLSPEFAEFLLYETDKSLVSRIPINLLEYYTTPIYSNAPTIDDPQRYMAYLESRPRELPENIDAIMDPDRVEMLPRDVSAIFHKDQLRKVVNNYEITLEETPTSYPFNFDRDDFRFFFGVDQFKGGERSNRVDVAIEIPVEIRGQAGSSFEETFHAAVVLWDAQYNEINRQERDIVLKSAPEVAEWASLLPTQMVFSLQEGYYRMGISIEGVNSRRTNSFRTAFDVTPYGGALAISDILFARAIHQTERPSHFTRGALDVVPHPVRAYSRKVALPIYFEIYNLTKDTQGTCEYTIEYRIVPHSEKKESFWDRFTGTDPIVSSKFNSSAVSEDDIQYISINTENLRRGSYDLLITLTDDLTQQVVFRRGTFSLVD
jgi:hypothetical protein